METREKIRLHKSFPHRIIPGNDRVCIAVVDDDIMYRQVVEVSLSKVPGSRVVGFESGEQCFRHFHKVHPDILILDYRLSEHAGNTAMDGLDVLREVKRIDNQATVIFLTNAGSPNVAVSAIKSGAADYIIKDQYGLTKLFNQVRRSALRIQIRRQEMRITRWITIGLIVIALLVAGTVLADHGEFSNVWNWLWFAFGSVCAILLIRNKVKKSNKNSPRHEADTYRSVKWID